MLVDRFPRVPDYRATGLLDGQAGHDVGRRRVVGGKYLLRVLCVLPTVSCADGGPLEVPDTQAPRAVAASIDSGSRSELVKVRASATGVGGAEFEQELSFRLRELEDGVAVDRLDAPSAIAMQWRGERPRPVRGPIASSSLTLSGGLQAFDRHGASIDPASEAEAAARRESLGLAPRVRGASVRPTRPGDAAARVGRRLTPESGAKLLADLRAMAGEGTAMVDGRLKFERAGEGGVTTWVFDPRVGGVVATTSRRPDNVEVRTRFLFRPDGEDGFARSEAKTEWVGESGEVLRTVEVTFTAERGGGS